MFGMGTSPPIARAMGSVSGPPAEMAVKPSFVVWTVPTTKTVIGAPSTDDVKWVQSDVGTDQGRREAFPTERVAKHAIFTHASVSDEITAAVSSFILSGGIRAVRFGTVYGRVYGVGGHMAPHSDHALRPSHVGTLVMIPYFDFDGGELCVGGVKIGCPPEGSTNCVLIPIGMEHSVAPVTRGTRYVCTVPVFGVEGVQPKFSPLDTAARPSMGCSFFD